MNKTFSFSYTSDDNGDRYLGNKSKTLVAQLHRRESNPKVFIWVYHYDETDEAILGEACIENKGCNLKIFEKKLEKEITDFIREIILEFNIEVTSL